MEAGCLLPGRRLIPRRSPEEVYTNSTIPKAKDEAADDFENEPTEPECEDRSLKGYGKGNRDVGAIRSNIDATNEKPNNISHTNWVALAATGNGHLGGISIACLETNKRCSESAREHYSHEAVVSYNHIDETGNIRDEDAYSADAQIGRQKATGQPANTTGIEANPGADADVDANGELDSDADGREYFINLEKPRKMSEKKRNDLTVFQDWILENQQEVARDTRKPAHDANGKSVAKLIRDSESRRIIENPREYQIELFERAKEKNIIAVLPTGSGKTLIAALLLRHVLEREVEDRRAGKLKRVAFFLVEKVALALQQHAVLECNLDYPFECLCGNTADSSWKKDLWHKKWEDQMGIVCTAAVLQDCLARSFIRMDQINLLIFDEAHHCKGRHPFARIIKDFYIPEKNLSKRPKIFGMTASPVDAQTDVLVAVHQLEGLMHAEIATISEESASYKQVQRDVSEKDCMYDQLRLPFITRLHQKIANSVKRNNVFAKHLAFSRESAVVLGAWCADRFWHLLLTDNMISKFVARTEQEYVAQFHGTLHSAGVQSLRHIMAEHHIPSLAKSPDHLSSKVLCLLAQLELRFGKPTHHKCIVFVEQRNAAMVLADVLKQPGVAPACLKPAPLVGSHTDMTPLTMSHKEQVLTIAKFKQGEYNCLLATSVAEEGIDIPDCDIVIRFDLFNSVIQYVQSRGRARRVNSEYLCLSERGNGKQMKTKVQTTYDLAAIRDFCQALPENRKVVGWDAEAATEHAERHHSFYVVPSTGARLTWTGSLVILAAFTSSLHFGEEMLSPTYMVSFVDGHYVCDVQLPSTSPINNAIGSPQQSKKNARCSAAFDLCMELLRKGHLDENLQPVTSKKLPAMRNARLAVSSKKSAGYKMRFKPEIWSRLGHVVSLYATVLALDAPDAIGRSSQPLVLLTRQHLPDMPTIPLFFGKGQKSHVRPLSLSRPLELAQNQMEALKVFTLKVFKDVYSKEYESEAKDLPYFLAPCAKGHAYAASKIHIAEDAIDWVHLRSTQDLEYLQWDECAPDDFFEDKFVIDPSSGSRKFYLRGVRRDMKPQDPVPEGVPHPGHRSWREVEHSIQEYSISLWQASRSKRVWCQDQPVVEAELLSLRRNFLDEFFDEEREVSNTCYLIVEPLRVSTLPLPFVIMALTFPAIIHRLEDSLIALDACDVLGLKIRPDLALEALTKDSDNSGEHDLEQVNFQAGMGNNYERLEFLGDCFLKMATTISLFTQLPDSNEFEYHVERMLLVCNQNLFNVALTKNLQEYVRSRQFDRRSWYPDGLKLRRGKAKRAKGSHSLADKSIADVCEALIGAAYETYADEGNFDMAIKAVTAVVNHKRHKMESWSEYYSAFEIPVWQSEQATAVQLELAEQIEKQMGYRFESPALLRSAFKHPSYPRQYENVPHYQRLEFLGDALLDMVCVDFLFHEFPQADPQWLTEHKMAMVSNHFLGNLCVKLGFSKRILHFSSDMTNQVAEYVECLNNARAEAELEAQETGTTVAQDYWLRVSQAPKFLSDVVEAYVGALFVDSKYDYGRVQEFFEVHVRPFFTDMALYDSFASRHPVTSLAHAMQDDFGCREWRLLVSEVPCTVEEAGAQALSVTEVVCGFMVHGKVSVHAKSTSGRYAKIAAAKMAIEKLVGLDGVDEFRREFNCNCERVENGDKAEDVVDILEHATAC